MVGYAVPRRLSSLASIVGCLVPLIAVLTACASSHLSLVPARIQAQHGALQQLTALDVRVAQDARHLAAATTQRGDGPAGAVLGADASRLEAAGKHESDVLRRLARGSSAGARYAGLLAAAVSDEIAEAAALRRAAGLVGADPSLLRDASAFLESIHAARRAADRAVSAARYAAAFRREHRTVLRYTASRG